jgi:hypothetical protein
MRLLYQGVGGSVLALANEDEEYYVVQLVGKVGRKSYQTALREVTKNLADEPYPAFLLNIKDLQSQPDLAGYWFWAHFVPRYYKKVGKCKIAIVRSKQTVWHSQLSKVTNLFKAGRMDIELHFFDAVNPAQDWLIDGILPEQPTLKGVLQKKIPKVKIKLPAFAFWKRKKKEEQAEEPEEEEEENFKDEMLEEDEDEPKAKKRFFLLRAWDWVRDKAQAISFLKNVKVKVKFDPKGRLKDEEEN